MNKSLLLAFIVGWLLSSVLTPIVGSVLLVVVITVVVLILALISRDQNAQLLLIFSAVLGAAVALLAPDLRASGDGLILALFALLLAVQV